MPARPKLCDWHRLGVPEDVQRGRYRWCNPGCPECELKVTAGKASHGDPTAKQLRKLLNGLRAGAAMERRERMGISLA